MTDDYLEIKNWDKWQSYRKDRGTPPWIKVHRNLMTNMAWAMLTDAEKGQLVSLWIMAADKNGKIPSNKKILQKICCLDNEPEIEKFIELQFLTAHDNQMTTKCQPNDAPETETETETEREAISLYNSLAKSKNLPKVQKLTQGRKKKLRARLKDCDGIDGWRAALEKVSNSKFCCGENDRGWRADLDFILSENSFIKIMEGKYDGKSQEKRRDGYQGM